MHSKRGLLAVAGLSMCLACGCGVESGADEQDAIAKPQQAGDVGITATMESVVVHDRPGYNRPGYDPFNRGLNPPGYNPPGTGTTHPPPGYNPPGYDPMHPIANPPG